MLDSQNFNASWVTGKPLELPPGKVICVGRNYAEHARELNHAIPKTPIIFMKPATAMVDFSQPIQIPQGLGDCHFECELACLIGKPLSHADPSAAYGAITGLGLALDLTLRDLQNKLKEKGHPWERAKAFDGACPLSAWVPLNRFVEAHHTEIHHVETTVIDWSKLSFEFFINQSLRQQGNPSTMLFQIPELIAYMSQWFTLMPGDVVLTGTPKGVGVLSSGMQLEATLTYADKTLLEVTTQVV